MVWATDTVQRVAIVYNINPITLAAVILGIAAFIIDATIACIVMYIRFFKLAPSPEVRGEGHERGKSVYASPGVDL